MSVLTQLKETMVGATSAIASAVTEKTVEQLSLEREKVEHSLADLERAVDLATLDNENGVESADAVLLEATTALAQAQHRIATLNRAIVATKIRNDERTAAAKATIRKAQVRAVATHAKKRDEAALRLNIALENLGNAWRELQDSTAKIVSALPADAGNMGGYLINRGEITATVSNAVWRYCGTDDLDGSGAMPGATASHLPFNLKQNRPEIPPLPNQFKSATASMMQKLRGEAIESE